MTSVSYFPIRDFVFDRLKKISGILDQGQIAEEIENTKKVIQFTPVSSLNIIFGTEDFQTLNNSQWKELGRELETHFNVKMENGILIQGNDQKNRDTYWWTSVEKQQNQNYYWTRYYDFLKESLPPNVIKAINDDTDVVMNNLENPSQTSFSRYGMVVGHVQSGKTGNYAGLVCKAADAGYKFIVVIAGGMNNLRNQTQERLNESFVGETNGVQVGAGKGSSNKEKMPLSLTTIQKDFNKRDADTASQGLNFDNISVPVLIVIKKNTKSLKNVIDWLQKQYLNRVHNHGMLIIDDESDYASINTKDEENPTAINTGIRTLLSLFHKSAYVAYTATPYANIFIDHEAQNDEVGIDLFPKDFIYALDAPTNYFGARKIFLDTDEQHIVSINKDLSYLPLDHKSDFKIDFLPEQLKDAIQLFLINIGVRNLRGQQKQHNSMLIHASRFTSVHQNIARLVSEYLVEVRKEFVSYGKLYYSELHCEKISSVQSVFERHCSHLQENWEDIMVAITDNIESVIVREVHQRTSIPLEYREDTVTNAIVIGGSSLSRGYTVLGLHVSYFLRSTVFYDTLMQMGRWFGYRNGYEDLCKIFMSTQKIDDFRDIILATEDLYADFKVMAENESTPSEFGLAVRQNPDSALQVTARNKQKNVTEFIYSMRLDGTLKETSYLPSDSNVINNNLETIHNLVRNLSGQNHTVEGKTNIWRNIDKKFVINFLESFKTYDKDALGLSSRMPISFIKKYLEDKNNNWDIALYSGSGEKFNICGIEIKKQSRKFDIKTGYYEVKNRQVSSGSAESIAIEDIEKRELIKNDRKKVRQEMEKSTGRPLLMLHVIQPEIPGQCLNEIAAFGISFPGSVVSKSETVKLKINTVYFKNLMDQLNDESESDD
jgi:hypothetical protein